MPEHKNKNFDRPGGYSTPLGSIASQRHNEDYNEVTLLGDQANPHTPERKQIFPNHSLSAPDTSLYIGDCREVLANLPEKGAVDLIFADPPFNWDVPYENWSDDMPRSVFERFTFDWLDLCIDLLSPTGAMWVNIPDDTAAEAVSRKPARAGGASRIARRRRDVCQDARTPARDRGAARSRQRRSGRRSRTQAQLHYPPRQ